MITLAGWLVALAAGVLALVLIGDRHRRLEALARAAHELRGPLQAIGLASRGSPHTQAIGLELERARQALDDLQSGRRDLSPSTAAAREQIGAREVLESAYAAARARGAEVTYEWHGPAVVVSGSRVRIAQALANLIVNAQEHGRSPVTLIGRGGRGTVRYEVSDAGPGLPAPVAELAARARNGRGRRGRGLAIAQDIARAHGGRLAAAPAQRGARLVLELPADGVVEGDGRAKDARS